MFVKLTQNSKVPVKGDWQLTDESAVFLHGGFNVGLILSGMTVVDFDDKAKAREWYKANEAIISTVVETRRGAHFYFANGTTQRKFEFGDIKSGEHSYVVCPPSIVDGFRYRFVQSGILQPFPEDLFPIEKKEVRQPIDENDPAQRIMRAHKWLKKRNPAISGQGGHLQMIKTCRAMFGMFNLTEGEALPLILEYNEKCEPPFNDKEILHKLKDAQNGTHPSEDRNV